ncbi:MAG: glycosyltransferase [Lactimicrobium massiliense]|nr:glycosyltransferase [Lactimicrobium massiliense]MDD6229287.1 glycosyltransferase [Lactimicrobium massiliense]MDD6559922.1 glycosyltransferase [Lactimicrobium massiliense]
MPKVSIVIPIYNVEKYLAQCLDSVCNQTLKDIEIICVNDGSTDHSPDIIREYMKKDSRIKMIDKANSGYGISMNMGFDKAEGEYIGIVESDDYADPNMFEDLYHKAKNDNLDVVKSSYYLYYSIPSERNTPQVIVSKAMDGRVICPRTYFEAPLEKAEFFNIKPTIWSAIYRKDFIRDNNIRFNETPGASYQDAGFNFKVWTCCERGALLGNCYLHYRQDNENSSVNSVGKVFCVCDEYAEMERFLNQHLEWKDQMEPVKTRLKFDSYMWNYGRVAEKFKFLFLEKASQELKDDLEKGYADKAYFEDFRWERMMSLIKDPISFYTDSRIEDAEQLQKKYDDVLNSTSYKVGSAVTFIPRKVWGGIKCVRIHGLSYTLKYMKVKGKI